MDSPIFHGRYANGTWGQSYHSCIWYLNVGLSKRDITRKKKSLEDKLQELEAKAKKNPLNKSLQEEVKDMKKKIEKL